MSDENQDMKISFKHCKTCGKSGQLDFCSKDCLEKYKQQKENHKEPSKPVENLPQKANVLTDELRDGAFQRGIMWRKNKLLAIHRARKEGITDNDILRELRIGGITIQKSRELMRDSEELFGK